MSPLFALPQPLTTINCCVSKDLPILDILCTWNYMICGLPRLASFAEHNVFGVHACCGPCRCLIPCLAEDHSVVQICHVSLSTLLAMSSWAGSPFWLFNSRTFVYAFLFEYLFSALLGLYPGAALLHHKVTLYLTCGETARLLSTAAAPFYTPSSEEGGFRLFRIPANTCYST